MHILTGQMFENNFDRVLLSQKNQIYYPCLLPKILSVLLFGIYCKFGVFLFIFKVKKGPFSFSLQVHVGMCFHWQELPCFEVCVGVVAQGVTDKAYEIALLHMCGETST